MQADLRMRVYTDPFFALESIIRTDNRDRQGQTVPMRALPAQRGWLELVQKIRALNFAEQFLDGHVARSLFPDLSSDLRTRFEQILAIGPDLVWETLRLEGLEESATDGPVRIDTLKCRRGGVSSITQALLMLRANLTKLRAITIAQKGTNADLIFGYTRKFWTQWAPDFLELRQAAVTMGKDNSWDNGSFARCFTAGGKDSGRGDQADFYHLAEVAFFPSFDEVKATLAAAPAHAWIFLETTANGVGGGFYGHYQQTLTFEQVLNAKCNGDAATLASWNGFYRFFFSWLSEPAYRKSLYDWERKHLLETLDDRERALVAIHGATPEQLQWRRDRIKMSGSDTEAVVSGLTPEQWFQQEFPADEEEAFQSSGSRVFGQEGVDRCRVEAKTKSPGFFQLLPERPIVRIRREFSTLTIWDKPKPGHLYSMGVDISKGVSGGDFTVMTILDRGDGTRAKEAATWRGRHQPEALADVIATLATWYNDAFIVPELEGAAQATIHRLVRVLQYPNVFHRAAIDRVQDKAQDSSSWTYGWFPSPQAKAQAVWSLARALEDGAVTFYSDTTLDELQAYQQDEDHSFSAPEGKHDDCVTAAYLAWLGHMTPQNLPVDVGALVAAEEKARVETPRESADAAIWEYLRKLEEKDEKVLRKSSFYRKNGYLPG